LNPNYDVINDVISGFAKVVAERCGFHHQLDSAEDFMGRGGLRFSLSLIVSQLWRHNDVLSTFAEVVVQRCGLHPRLWTT